MVNTSYSASLVSSLLSAPAKTIRTTRDLIESSLQFAAENISYNVGLFAVSRPKFPALFQLQQNITHICISHDVNSSLLP
jgi:hypothetical protein